MSGFAIPLMLRQHAQSRDTERVAAHLDAQTVEACRQRDAAIKRAEAAEELAKQNAMKLLIQTAHSEALLAQIRALAAAHPDSPLLALTGKTKGDGRPEKVMNRDVYNPTFDALIKKAGIGDPLRFRY